MYYIFRRPDSPHYIQVRDTDRKSMDWVRDRIPAWDESSKFCWGSHPFRDHGFTLIAYRDIPFEPCTIEKFFAIYPEFVI